MLQTTCIQYNITYLHSIYYTYIIRQYYRIFYFIDRKNYQLFHSFKKKKSHNRIYANAINYNLSNKQFMEFKKKKKPNYFNIKFIKIIE